MKSLKAKIYTALGFDSLKPWQIETRLMLIKFTAAIILIMAGGTYYMIYSIESHFNASADKLELTFKSIHDDAKDLRTDIKGTGERLGGKLYDLHMQLKDMSKDLQEINADLKAILIQLKEEEALKGKSHEKQTHLQK